MNSVKTFTKRDRAHVDRLVNIAVNLDSSGNIDEQDLITVIFNISTSRTIKRLRCFIIHRSFSSAFRLAGDIERAKVHEEIAEQFYNHLPDDLKW